MILLQAKDISKYFGAKQILNHINLSIQKNERVGLVGVNGAGKTTLLKLLAGQLVPDAGEINRCAGLTTGYLAQDSGLESTRTIYEEMISVFQHLVDQEQQMRRLEEMMGDSESKSDPVRHQRIMNQYALLAENFRHQGGYTYRSHIRGILQGLDFPEVQDNSPVSVLSGGQKTRLALAKNLLLKPDLLILDEPTNYLDVDSLAWLEQYLQNYSGALLVVSHDRYFLDKVVSKVVELEYGQATTYKSNYSGFVELKAQQQKSQLKQYEQQQEEINRAKDFIQRNMARASTTKRAQSRLKALEKMERLDAPSAAQKRVCFSFQIHHPSGKDVLQVSDLKIGYPGGISLSQNITFSVERGESVALLGPNGTGKTTLLKTLVGELAPLGGSIRQGSNLSIGYYSQEQERLSSGKTVLDELWDAYRLTDERDIRTLLGNFLFQGEDVYKKVDNLSGGEKARLSLAKLMLQKANLLILDEPTNHLDILSREVLESALVDYPGTILFVSHDRYFLNKMATRIIELTADGIHNYTGGYDYYLEKRDQQGLPLKEKTASLNPQESKKSYLENKEAQRLERKRLKRIEELESLIRQTEEAVRQIEIALENPEVTRDYESCLKLSAELDSRRSTLDGYLEEWVELSET
ncbi:ABC-F family ATP-binding cassette domain-containing protein [Desulforamulus ruminis]|uniref:ABC transporter related protein n=1 Tax=Desulforamulus ruminis (strain ATCC 23193 / DSM 2154 / NCIMB 8452 / DL) TaxID=696281 RepID=F6DQF4_DESRL|nr:ABC-F type ribosomal protection protein [Desulforamulus ruminis]AEG60848.1 ABC transporter related protein [Desulforamulus ruminis DSM 2154]